VTGPVRPPGNSLEPAQEGRILEPRDGVVAALQALLDRIGEEIAFNDAKGGGAYRLGVHDALRFAEEAIVELLRAHGHAAEAPSRPNDA
jgi:hypothetical protein